MYLLGIDDAGRGPILGPMYLAGVLIKSEEEPFLKEIGAKDSKLLTQAQRIIIEKEIIKIALGTYITESLPKEIDTAVDGGENLNTLEARKAAQIINNLNTVSEKIKVIVDCPSVNTEAWKKTMMKFITNTKNLDIHCEHKADFNYPVVGAASILAKVAREIAVEKIKAQFGETGSGYPADPFTKEFLKKAGLALAETGIVRTSWATWRELHGLQLVKKKFPITQKKLF